MAISGRFVLLAGALWWGLGFPVVGRAQTVFVKNLLEANWTDVSWDRTLGTPFTVGDESARVSALGFFDEKGDGLAVAHEVGIYGPDHALLGKVTVPAGTAAPLRQGARWVSLTQPILLASNTPYMLAATVKTDVDRINAANPTSARIHSGFSLAGTGYQFASGEELQYPDVETQTMVYGFGGNFELAACPNCGAWTNITGRIAGANLPVMASALSPSGDLYFGGGFWSAGNVLSPCIVRYSPASGQWSEVGQGITTIALAQPDVSAVAVDAGGNVYIGGKFTEAGGTKVNGIARWDGRLWSPLGSGTDKLVKALVVDAAGNLYAGGSFTVAGGVSANHVARWNGSQWSALGGGVNGDVESLVLDGAGQLYAGGVFTTAGNRPAHNIACWSGQDWTALADGPIEGTDAQVECLAVDAAGVLYAGGGFTNAGGVVAQHIAKWDGQHWSALGSGVNGTVYTLRAGAAGEIFAGGLFSQAGGLSVSRVARWADGAWSGLGAGFPSGGDVRTLARTANGRLYAGGTFGRSGDGVAQHVAVWDGAAWSALDTGSDGDGGVLASDGQGNLYVGGDFTTLRNIQANYVARWDGVRWESLGSGLGGGVLALAHDQVGTLYASGQFAAAGGVSARFIARWNGTNWSPLGEGLNGPAFALATDRAGNLYAGGIFTRAGDEDASLVAKWDGTNWTALGTGLGDGRGTAARVTGLGCDAAGNLYAAGVFYQAGDRVVTNIAKWDGAAWSSLGSGITESSFTVQQPVLCDQRGNVYVGGGLLGAGGVAVSGIAKWDGTAWSALGKGVFFGTSSVGSVLGMTLDANDELYAGGAFMGAGEVPASYIAKWDGASWSAVGAGVNGGVLAMLIHSDKCLYAAGYFTTAGGLAAPYVAKWDPKASSYTLKVDGGAGSGGYSPGARIPIRPTFWLDEGFDHWTGDVAAVDNPATPLTYVQMPTADVNVSVSYLPRLQISLQTGGASVTIRWSSEAMGYTLKSASQVPQGPWTPVSGVIGNEVTLPISGAGQFYRLEK